MADTTIIDYSLWAVELGRDEYSDSAYEFQRADHQVRQLQQERRRLTEQAQQQKGQGKNGTQS